MPASSSSIPAVTDALLARLTAATWPGDVPTICDSDPDTPPREVIVVGDTLGGDQQWMTFGKSRIETYDLRLAVMVDTPGLTQKQARDRAFDLFAVIESALATDPKLGLTDTTGRVVLVVALSQPEHLQGPSDEGRFCAIRSALHVQAQINPAEGD